MSPGTYDLVRPKGLDRNELRLLRLHFGNLARHAGIELTTLLRRNCTVTLTGEIESPWTDFTEMMDRRPYLALFNLAPLSGTGVFAIPRDTAVRMLEMRLGGGHRPPYEAYKQLTDTDYSVISSVANGVVSVIGSTFARSRKLNASLVRQITDTQVRELAGQSDMYVVGCFNLVLGDDSVVEMFVGFPFVLVRQIVETLRTAEAVALTEEEPIALSTVVEVPLDLRLEARPIELTPAALAGLEVGDVLRLDQPVAGALDLKVGGVLVARARIGRARSRLACVVVQSDPDAAHAPRAAG